MQRIKIVQPDQYAFSTQIAVRITDLNYGNHVGNDAFLALIHEARVQFLNSMGYTELNLAGVGLIMADAAMEYKAEMHYGDVVTIEVAAANIISIGFDIIYRMTINTAGSTRLAGIAKTGMICYDYTNKKKVSIPAEALQKLGG